MSDPQAQAGDMLEDISPEILGFSPLSAGLEGAKKLKLLPSPWSVDSLPPASAQLLSVGPRRGFLAAASPDKLVIASTKRVRNAFQEKAGEKDIVSDFSPDVTLPVPRLRQVAFSADEDFLVTSAENDGGLSVYSVDELLKGNTQPGVQVATNNISVRALLPNPATEQAHYMAVVLDSGRLDITDVTSGNAKTVHNGRVTCAAWSLKGKAFVAGFEDGTASIHLVSALDQVKGKVPRPPELGDGYKVSAVNWLNNEELFLIYSPEGPGDDSVYYMAATNKTYSSFTFRQTPFEVVFSSITGPTRTSPPRFSVQRLRKWEPDLEDMIIVAAAHSSDIGVITRARKPLDSAMPTANEFQLTSLADHRKAGVPTTADDAESTLIGEALDLSATEKAPQPSARLEEINESPTPLPAYFLLTYEGLLVGWWVVWDNALEAGTAYPHLISAEASASATQTTSAAPASQLVQPSASAFGQATPSQKSPFGNVQSTPGFGKPSFGAPSFGSPSTPASLGFGKPSFPGATTSAAPAAFGAPSQISAKPNPFGSGGATPASKIPNPFSATPGGSQNNKANPFAAGLTKLGSGAPGTSPFSNINNKDGQSGFGGLGSKTGSGFGGLGQKGGSGFGGLGQQSGSSFGGLGQQTGSGFGAFASKEQSSFGNFGKPPLSTSASTVTVDSKATGPGSTLPSLGGTPAQQSSSSFPSFTSTQSGSTDFGNRGREEATPTPQQPHLKDIAGISGGKFELKSSFKGDGSAKDDLPRPSSSSGGSLFGSGFGNALNNVASKVPETPAKDANKASFIASTTPATAPRPGLFSMRNDSATPKAAPPTTIPEEAPLPPDWRSTKPSKTDDEIPPLAGSPPVKIEAPSSPGDMSQIPSSPLEDDEDGDLSEQDDEDEGEEELSEDEEQTGDEQSDQSESPQPKLGLFGNRANAAPSLFPAAPTPPPQKVQRPPSNQNMASSSMFSGTRRDPLSSSVRPPSKPPTPQPVFSDLVDDEDERIREELASEIEPSRTLAPFIARQEYTDAALNKTGHAAQIEIVYRDINSMVDTLGLNSRTLQSFIDFHEQPQRDDQLDRSALEEVADAGPDGPWFDHWSLCEIEDLMDIEDQLAHELSVGGIVKVVDKLSKAVRLIQENAKLQSKVNEERRRIINSKDPEKLEILRKAALPKELADQQKALRRDYAQLLTNLGKAEDALILLRSKLASHKAKNGETGAVPSVEAIKKTINKLIDITKEKNHDITLLESQLRKVSLAENGRPASRNAATPLRKQQRQQQIKADGTPFATPPTSRKTVTLRELNHNAMTPEAADNTPSKGYGLFYTPQGSPSVAGNGATGGAAAGAVVGIGGLGSLPALAERVDDELENLREKARRRKQIAESLGAVLAKRGVRRTRVVE